MKQSKLTDLVKQVLTHAEKVEAATDKHHRPTAADLERRRKAKQPLIDYLLIAQPHQQPQP